MQQRLLLVCGAILCAVALTGTAIAWRSRAAAPNAPAMAGGATVPLPSAAAGPVGDQDKTDIGAAIPTVRVQRGSLGDRLRAVGRITYDESRLADINLKLGGWIKDLYVTRTGQTVKVNQPLFTLYSPELAAAEAQLLAAMNSRDTVSAGQPADAREFAERQIDTPRQRLLRWDVPEDQLKDLEQTRRVPPAVLFRSFAEGVVIEKTVVKGMHVEAGQTLYKLADLSVVWAEAEFAQSDISRLVTGADALVTVDGDAGAPVRGRVMDLSPYVGEQTRTLRARIELPNPGHRLRPGMYVHVETAASRSDRLIVPSAAVFESGTRQVAFVAQADGPFVPRNVTLGSRSTGLTEIVSGLRENDQIAANASMLVDSDGQLRTPAVQGEAAGLDRVSPDKQVDVRVETRPDPPRRGDNALTVLIHDQAGQPVSDAGVRVALVMPAMPSMNMPAMRSEIGLDHVDGARYVGKATLPMAGRWDVEVTVSRPGRASAISRTSIEAR